MSKDSRIFKIICQSCGAKIEVDAQTRSVFSIEKKGMKKRSFEEVVEDVTSVPKHAQEKFKRGMEKQQQQKEHLEQLFKQAKKKAEKDPNKRPPSIFDYD